MNDEPEHIAKGGTNRDGLAALAIVLLAAALIAVVINSIV
jgi:hypothetical protein